jgi:exopolysaccharide biosynthesis polyprenyl glycosylphosphotransferase
VWSFNTLIIGTSQAAVKLEEKLRTSKKSMGFNIIGYVESYEGHESRNLNLPIYKLDELPQLCADYDIKNLIVIPHRQGIKATMSLINKLFPLDLPMYISPDLYHLITTKARVSNIVGEPLVDISRADMSDSTLNLKRVSDIIVSIIALIIISPLLLILAILVKCDSKGPVIYKQTRIGYHKKPFNIYKFRSMKVDAEANGPTLSTLDDPRITKLGKIMRKYRLDELPQFWNVVIGDMSLVGPRPEREFYIKQIITKAPYYSLIHQVRPGITSWGMVKYGYASNVDEMISRLKYDLLYIENVSFAVDLKILFYTIHTVFTGKGI